MLVQGSIVNAIVIICGSLLGMLIKGKLPERFKEIITQALGLSVIILGLSGSLSSIFRVASDGTLESKDIMLMIICLVLGSIIGEAIDIELKLNRFADFIQKKFSGLGGNFSEGFVTATLLFCVGALAIVGSLEEGLTGNADKLYAKSMLDGTSSFIFSTTMGIGVLFAAIPVLLYQGSITLLAGFLKPLLTPDVISQMSLVGNILILGIGLNILKIRSIKVANMLPAIFLPIVYYLISILFHF
ncbi:MAG: putative membrane protein YdfK [Firmicutes bacterium ADurb.Bin419]|nr:MAG: putative membrane protein YdfK [Firmicutes bacterium ADurb.Bin419]